MISTTKERWGRLDLKVAQRHDISANAKVVFAVLRCYQNDETGRCDPTRTMIADDAGTSISSVKRAIKQLMDAGIIKIDFVPGTTRHSYQIIEGGGQNEPSRGSNRPLKGVKMNPPRVQYDPSLLYNDEKNSTRTRKEHKREDNGFIQPTIEQQEIAIRLLNRWNNLYKHTVRLSDVFQDQAAFHTLQTVHGLSEDELEQIVDGMDDQIRYWTRPKFLLNHIGRDSSQPLVFRRIQSEIERRQTKPRHTPKRSIGSQYLDVFRKIEGGVKV